VFEIFDPQADYVISGGSSLPHWYQPRVTYFITFRTEDSIPLDVSRRRHAQRFEWLRDHRVNDFEVDFIRLPIQQRKEFHERFSREYLETLDKGLGDCVLAQPELSSIVADSLFHFDTIRYHLGDFVVMPNHVHLIACLLGDTEIKSQCRSWKRFTARRINSALNRNGRFWQEESFDHLIRSPEQFAAVVQYIEQNPRKLNFDEYFHYRREQG
jgi:type I restriction enzyme R subunit